MLSCVASLAGCGDNQDPLAAGTPYEFELPAHFPLPVVPARNPMTEEKVELGRLLFYDERVSADQTHACSTCHRPEQAFAGPTAGSIAHDGAVATRSVPGLANAAYMSTLTWASLDHYELEQLAVSGDVLARLRADPVYESLGSARDVSDALASFVRTLISGGSVFDVYTYERDLTALSESAERGFGLFYSERLGCFVCHDGFNLSSATRFAGLQGSPTAFHNTGLYNVDGAGGYPASDRGLFERTGRSEDIGTFRTPSLRNIALTGPYYHDDSAPDLGSVLDHYAAGGRVIDEGPGAGDGRASPLKSELVAGFELTAMERADLLAFFDSLTDAVFVSDPRFANPWIQ
jgi:cytochrome c peroxidase